MKLQKRRIIKNLALAATALLLTASSHAQSADALLKKLVEKKILTEEEAATLRDESQKEAEKNFNTSFSHKIALADWITMLRFSGDFRGRFEENNAENPAYHTRDRYRIRARLGAYMTLADHFDVGVRLATGNPQTNPGGTLVGGQSITANQDLNSFESRKFIWLDAAYARWVPIDDNDWTVSGTIGKMDNPFQLSNMIWDYDVDPEGAAFKIAHRFTANQSLTANGGFFVLDELNQNSKVLTNSPALPVTHDPYILGAQLLWESKWSPHWESSLGVAGFSVHSHNSMSALVQPFYNSGNTRDASTGVLKYDYNPLIATASVTYKLDNFPLYNGPFPIRPNFEFMENPAAPRHNQGYRLGLSLGKAGKKHNWEINYRYQRLEADAWLDAMVDDDNGAFFATGNPQMAGTGKSNGWFGGTNVKGHWISATYSLTDFLTASMFFYLNDAIINAPKGSSDAQHFMAELNWKF